jgi:diguanylate cyclase (GGDEF)-like protein
MISLKKFLDSRAVTPESASVVTSPEPTSLLSAWQASLAAMAVNGQRAIPGLESTIDPALTRISADLTRDATPETIHDCRRRVDEELTQWADQAQERQKANEHTVRKLLLVVFEATDAHGIRDEKFSREISALSERLRVVAGLDSLPLMRHSIIENTRALNESVARMEDEGREAIRKLTGEITNYQVRLVASERRALVDPLTGLCNRRGFEQQLESRIQSALPFSLLVADLNEFKTANDRYGHIAGDEILRQFANELRAQFLPEDTVARWGGDEFVCIVGGPAKDGMARADRVRHWVAGEFRIQAGGQTLALRVDAAVGTAAWNGVESGLELFARADKEMYRMKQTSRAPA